MTDTLFVVLTDPAVRDAQKVREQVCSDFSAGWPWWDATEI
jgi:hypothetical protein